MEVSKRKLLIGTAASASIILIGAIYLLIDRDRVVQDPTICISENRRLSEKELREKALLSYIDTEERSNSEYKKRGDPIGDVVAGIIEHNINRDDLALSMRAISAKDVQFSEAFSIKPFPKNRLELYSLISRNNFTYVSYDISKDGDARFFPSKAFQPLKRERIFSDQIDKSEIKKGFGEFFFMLDYYPIRKACCDNEKGNDSPHEYYSKKLGATNENISYLVSRNVNRGIAVAVTGCGQVLTHKKLNGIHTIKHFYFK